MTQALNIMVVDDHSLFRKGLIYLLKTQYVDSVIVESVNGADCLALLQNFSPDLVLMDIEMPQMDGIATTRKAMAQFPDLRIIALSMYGDEVYYYKMIDAGTKGFLLKN